MPKKCHTILENFSIQIIQVVYAKAIYEKLESIYAFSLVTATILNPVVVTFETLNATDVCDITVDCATTNGIFEKVF